MPEPYLSVQMPIVPLIGHAELQERVRSAHRAGTLPASILLQGPRGIGKQRFALWMAQLLVCEQADAPCGQCRACRFALELKHPDIHWYFPRPRMKDGDPDLEDVRADYGEALAERASESGLYAPPSGSEGVYVATVRAIIQQAAISPALGRRKVFVIGDAERMVPQEGSEQAANAFLKLLEEPPNDSTVVLTSSEPGALLPTIRSRVVTFRMSRLPDDEIAAFMEVPAVSKRLTSDKSLPRAVDDRIELAAGSPGRLLMGAEWAAAMDNAQRMIDGALDRDSSPYEAAWAQASSRARGSFKETLDALTIMLHKRGRLASQRGDSRQAVGAARAIEAVEAAKERVASNVSPQLITVGLLRQIRELLA